MTDTEKKKPATVEVYSLSGGVKTSEGILRHGDRAKLPKDEADRLIKQGQCK